MENRSNAWECKCGHVEYAEFPPEECNKCWKLNAFERVSEERLEELQDNVLDDIRTESGDEDEEEEDDEY